MEIEKLKESTKKLLPDWVGGALVYNEVGHMLIFLTNVWPNGNLLGFYSHSPWGRSHDQEQGWCYIAADKEIINTCESRTQGQATGLVREWRGKLPKGSKKLMDQDTGEMIWKLND